MIKSKRMTHVGQMFSHISKTYDLLNHVLSFNIDKSWRKTAISYIKGKNVLDIATGTADIALAIYKKDPEKNIIGSDISFGMLEIAKQKTKNTSIKLVCADALYLPFKDSFFDNVIISFGIRNIKNKIQALYEFKRVLKPSGKLIILEFSKPKNPIINYAYIFYKDYCLPNIAGIISNNKDAYKYLAKTIRYFPNPEFLSNAIMQVGFKQVNFKLLSFGIACLHVACKEG
ncbi:bifunctional demethylmenaquinone methyltransferase/2-methoxy-6-polyprenyl-1,4-benzoquinol methylase UbiE [Desulfurella sp.]|uniref:bifunctional demethylmenaquinone methyltransferase/2-methoxy-6-polyprenyl-1,4-benzoquinol methylase UbiE n=1 Tax=Desulfurella sp. TaxID=1962857 RepID=UPI0025C2299F|nr:bifunctional demethylmenaquinone methyltransferase/2-methoxy-6-polyprenyl-1,4-benzoquinol methylase UbiE [Desulfurella sp.]